MNVHGSRPGRATKISENTKHLGKLRVITTVKSLNIDTYDRNHFISPSA
jgi:hypothetical protein